ncbi:MAG: transposase [Bdellovibrionales bacterium]|nr:transposase [Bdellovibrionales bacterium]
MSADETPHRMLEGSDKKSWYLWSFSSETACYFECHDTRSGDVSIEILKYAKCEVLLTDKYSGYERTVREVNILREQRGDPPLQSAFVTHSRRYFLKLWIPLWRLDFILSSTWKSIALTISFRACPWIKLCRDAKKCVPILRQ